MATIRRIALCILPALAIATAGAEAESADRPPKLTVVITIDQFSAELFRQYRPHWRDGMRRLATGTVFTNGFQAQSATETCPGHSTITTGAYPSRSGIVANNWVDLAVQRDDKVIYCAEDERVPGSSSSRYTVSPVHLLVPTFGERLKAANPASRSVAVAGKDRAAVMMSGSGVDQRWYWGTAGFVSDLDPGAPPAPVTRVNNAVAKALAEPRAPLPLAAECRGRARPIAIPGRDMAVGAGRLDRNAEDVNAFRASPELDEHTLALARGLVDELRLGRGRAPDTVSISLSATDYVGHQYGTEGTEMCLQLLALDRLLGDFLRHLDNSRLDYAIVLTADHGGLDIPERARLKGDLSATRADAALAPGRMGLALVEKLGLPGFGLQGEGAFGDTYIDKTLSPPDRRRLLSAAVKAYRKHPQVEAVFTAAELRAAPPPTASPDRWSLADRVRANFHPDRSGDFIVLLKQGVTPIWDTSRYVATHGSAWDYDRRVPIIFYRPGAAGREIVRPIATVDILPTLAADLGLPIAPHEVDGRCLPEATLGCNRTDTSKRLASP